MMRRGAAWVLVAAALGCSRQGEPTATKAASQPKALSPVDRAIEARGGRARLLGMATAHVRGTLTFPGGETAELDAYVDRKPPIDRALIQFRAAGAFRALGLRGNVGFERDESGKYREVAGEELVDLKASAESLLLASRFPLDGDWEGTSTPTWRRAADSLRVEIDAAGLPKEARRAAKEGAPAEDARSWTYGEWREDQGIRFPGRIEFFEGGKSAWVLKVREWDPQAAATDALFEIPKAPTPASKPAASQPASTRPR